MLGHPTDMLLVVATVLVMSVNGEVINYIATFFIFSALAP